MTFSRREYKTPINPKTMIEPQDARNLHRDVRRLCRNLGLHIEDTFTRSKSQEVEFLDTRDLGLFRSQRVLRLRKSVNGDVAEVTLKAMSPDRIIAAGSDARVEKKRRAETKLEEDIAPPFRSRFSHSATVELSESEVALLRNKPQVGDVIALFPGLKLLHSVGLKQNKSLRTVRKIRVLEDVFTGPTIALGSVAASVAIIVWKLSPKRAPVIAEMSFRYKLPRGDAAILAATQAAALFETLQSRPWALPNSGTKTAFVFHSSGVDA